MSDPEEKTALENIKNENKILPAENKEIPPIPEIEIKEEKKEKKKKENPKSIVFMPDYNLAEKKKKQVVNGNLAYNTEELQEAVNEYFDIYTGIQVIKDQDGNILRDKFGNLITNMKPPTVAGLSLFLGFDGRQSLYDYINRNNDSSYVIKKALSKIEEFAESMLYTGKPVGAIFWLKNHKWTDQQQIDVKSSSFEKWLQENYEDKKPNEIEEAKQIEE